MMAFGNVMEFIFFAAVGGLVAFPLLLLNLRIAPRLGLIDWPKARGVTEEQIPIVGHSLVIVAILTLFIVNQVFDLPPWYLVTAIGIAVMGHLDDRRPVSALDKMFFQLLAVSIVVYLDPGIRSALILKWEGWGTFWAFFFILGMMNSINFIDGIDGLGATVLMVGCLGLAFYSLSFPEHYPAFIVAAISFGALGPFLYLNVWKRAGFLGNVGSYFFAYLLAVLHASLPFQAPGPFSKLAISGLCFIIPIADSITVIFSRLTTFRSPFEADKGHLHHRLIQTSVTLRYILANFGAIELFSMLVGVLIARNSGIRNSVLPGLICISQIAVASILILLIEKASKRRIQSYFQRLDSGEAIYFIKFQFTHVDGSPISRVSLRRLEARVSAEIRVTDLCYSEEPNLLFVTVSSAAEPVKGISSRLQAVFQAEQVVSTAVVEQGEFRKLPSPLRKPARKSA